MARQLQTISSLPEAYFEACSANMSPLDLKQYIDLAGPRKRTIFEVYNHVAQNAIENAGGRGAILTMSRTLKALFFEAHARGTRRITPEIREAAASRLGGLAGQDAILELTRYVLQDQMSLIHILPDYESKDCPTRHWAACHSSFQTFYAAAALLEFPDLRLYEAPWRLNSEWDEVLRFGCDNGDPFWLSLLRAAPDHDPEAAFRKAVSIRNVVCGDRRTALAAISGLLRVAPDASHLASLDWSELMLDDAQGVAIFSFFAKGTLPRLKRLSLNDNALGPDTLRQFGASLSVGAMPQLEDLKLSNNDIGDEGALLLADAIAAGALVNLVSLTLNQNEIGNPGILGLMNALQKTKACPDGPLPRLEILTLAYNNVEEEGLRAIASACANGCLPSLQRFLIARNPAASPKIVADAILAARRPRPRKILPLYVWTEEQERLAATAQRVAAASQGSITGSGTDV